MEKKLRAHTDYDTTSTVDECAIVTGKDILVDRGKIQVTFMLFTFFSLSRGEFLLYLRRVERFKCAWSGAFWKDNGKF